MILFNSRGETFDCNRSLPGFLIYISYIFKYILILFAARDLFIRCGKKLQRRRQENEWRLAASRISLESDPADKNEELKKKLYENMQMAIKKETYVLNKLVYLNIIYINIFFYC